VDIVRTNNILRNWFQEERVYEDRKKIFELSAYKTLVTGVKIFQRLKNQLSSEEKKKYLSFLKEGYHELEKSIVLGEFKGVSKLYHQLVLSSFQGMMLYYKFKN